MVGIKNMKKERDTLNRELVIDKANQAKIENKIQAKFENIEKMGTMVSFLEEKLEAYETLINESEEAYNKVKYYNVDHRECWKTGYCITRTMRQNRRESLNCKITLYQCLINLSFSIS